MIVHMLCIASVLLDARGRGASFYINKITAYALFVIKPNHHTAPALYCRYGTTKNHCMLYGSAVLFLSFAQLSQHTKTHMVDPDMQSTVSRCGDTRDIEPDSINPEWPICTGYLDTALIDTNMQSTLSVSSCADTNYIEPDTITPEWPICTGYLDTTLAIFKRHKHPFIRISTLAMRWSGAKNLK